MAHSLALVNFLPDAGHVFPLLRVAAAFSERGYDVVCYLPQECEKCLKGYDFRFVSLGPVFNASMKEEYSKTLCKLSKKSIFYNAFSNYMDLSDSFWEPLKLNVSKHMPLVKSYLAEQRPLFMLSDTHIFHWWYVKLSADTETPLVLHSVEGHRHCQNSYVETYGISNLPWQLQVPVEYLGMFSKRLFRLFGLRNRIRRFRTRLAGDKNLDEVNEWESTLATATAQDCATLQPTFISTGCGYFEQQFLKSTLRICDGLQVFGPLRPKSVVQLSSELRKWLESSNVPVVYVSFGSMIHLGSGIVRAIIAGLTMLNVRVLWSMPKAQQDEFLSELDIPAAVRFEDFLPPLEVLTMPVVRCGINHGGAGSVQDCLLSGKPMLCIPFMWDQPFNSSVVSSLGIGKRLWKRQVSARTIARAVDSLLHDNRFALRAMNLATEPLYSSSESDVVEHVLNQPSISSRARKLLDREGISPDVGPVPR